MAATDHLSIWLLFNFPLVSGYCSFLHVYPPSLSIGKHNITYACGYAYFWVIPAENELRWEIRQNDDNEFIPVVKANSSGTYQTNEEIELRGFKLQSFSSDCIYYLSQCTLYITISLETDTCIIDLEKSASCRFSILYGNETFYSSVKNIFSIKGHSPETMLNISIVNQRLPLGGNKTMFEIDDVLHLQCTGEVENINAISSQDIRWCKKENGKFKVLLLQDPPRASLFERSKDGCRVVQKSVIFYRISENDTNLEFMCESRYEPVCGAQGINLTLSVPTIVKSTDKWQMSPILVHDKRSIIYPGRLELDGSARTIILECTASIRSKDSSVAKPINWCVRKQNNFTWTNISLQGNVKQISSNSMEEISISSKIKYHITVFDKDVHFLCEISNNSTCGTGLVSSNISIHVTLDENEVVPPPNVNEPECNVIGVIVVSVILGFILALGMIFLIVLFRRREVHICGLVIKTKNGERIFRIKQIENQSSPWLQGYMYKRKTQSSTRDTKHPDATLQSHEQENRTLSTKTGSNMDTSCDTSDVDCYKSTYCSNTIGRESFYENLAFEQDKKEAIYEEEIRKQAEQDYEGLRF